MMSSRDEVVLRKPTREEIDKITTNVVLQVQTRGMLHKNDDNKVSSIFINKSKTKELKTRKPKDGCDIKVKTANKKWEPKKIDVTKGPKAQCNESQKGE